MRRGQGLVWLGSDSQQKQIQIYFSNLQNTKLRKRVNSLLRNHNKKKCQLLRFMGSDARELHLILNSALFQICKLKVFSVVVSHCIFIWKLRKYRVDEQIVRWGKNWLDHQTQGVVINGSSSSWLTVTGRESQSPVLRPILFNIFSKDLDNNQVYLQQVCR